MSEELHLAVRTVRQLRDVLAVISEAAGAMSPAAISSVAGLASAAADHALDQLGVPS